MLTRFGLNYFIIKEGLFLRVLAEHKYNLKSSTYMENVEKAAFALHRQLYTTYTCGVVKPLLYFVVATKKRYIYIMNQLDQSNITHQ